MTPRPLDRLDLDAVRAAARALDAAGDALMRPDGGEAAGRLVARARAIVEALERGRVEHGGQ